MYGRSSFPLFAVIAAILLLAAVTVAALGFYTITAEVNESAQLYDADKTFWGTYDHPYSDLSLDYRFAQFDPGAPTIGTNIYHIVYDNATIPGFLSGRAYYSFSELIFVDDFATFTLGFNVNGDFSRYHPSATSIFGGQDKYKIFDITLYSGINSAASDYIQFIICGVDPNDDFTEYQSLQFGVRYYINGVGNTKLIGEFDWSQFYYDTNQYVIQLVIPSSFFDSPDDLTSRRFLDYNATMSSYLSTSFQYFPDSINYECVLATTSLYNLTFNLPDMLITSSDDGYDAGYSAGFVNGQNSVNTSTIYDEGYVAGYQNGYNNGVAVGQGDISSSISGFLPSILGAAGDFIVKVLDFEVFGVSMLTILGTFGAIFVLAMFVKMVM